MHQYANQQIQLILGVVCVTFSITNMPVRYLQIFSDFTVMESQILIMQTYISLFLHYFGIAIQLARDPLYNRYVLSFSTLSSN